MTELLKEKVEQVVWGKDANVSAAVRAIVLEEVRYRLLLNNIWDLQAWARSKAEEHTQAYSRINTIILSVLKNAEEGEQGNHHSLQKLSQHHKNIAQRYNAAANACKE